MSARIAYIKSIGTQRKCQRIGTEKLHRVRTDGYDVDVHGLEVVAGGFVHAGVGHYSIELVCHCDEGQSSLVYLAGIKDCYDLAGALDHDLVDVRFLETWGR